MRGEAGRLGGRCTMRLLAYYDGKIVDMNAFCDERKAFIGDRKQRFHLACMRVLDNVRTGYVLEGDKLYLNTQGKRTAYLVTGEERERVLREIEQLGVSK